jgi:3-oxoacyl-[acyl-carrier-protein] synthase II
VTAPKSFFGTLGAGAGILELAASLVGLGHGQVPPTLNFEHADPACPVNVVHGEPAPASAGAVLKINVARTGQAAAAVVLPGD